MADADASEQLARARASARRGQWQLAEQLYREIISAEPDQVDALEGLGLIALRTQRADDARGWLERAHAIEPRSARIVGNLGLALRQSGQLERALACYAEACTLDPSDPALLVNRARAERDAGHRTAAIAAFRRALELRPGAAEVWSMLSNTLREADDAAAALIAARRALALDPWAFDAHLNEGAALQSLGKSEDAAASYIVAAGGAGVRSPALANLGRLLGQCATSVPAARIAHALLATGNLIPEHALDLRALAHAAREGGRPATAIGCLERALALAPSSAGYRELAALLTGVGRADAACDRWLSAIELAPGEPESYRELGLALARRGRIAGVESRWSRAVAACPSDAEALIRLGVAAQRLGRPDDAETLYRRLVALRPELPDVHFYLGSALTKQGRHREAHVAYERALALDPRCWVAHGNLLFGLHFDPDQSPEAIFERHRAFGAQLEAASAELRTPRGERCQGARDPERRLRIGYVSPDFCAHAVSHFVEPVLREHDATTFEVYCYSDVPRPDAVTQRLAGLVPTFVATSGWSHAAVYERIRADRIDILVDLAGHTAKNRLPVFAREPSPIQVSWLGYFDTTGLASIDYRIADAASVPPGHERYFVERVLRLPRSANCYQPPPAPELPLPPCLERGHVTFGYFNNPTKLGRQVVAAAARILQALPDARLLLKYRSFEQPALRARVEAEFAAEGVDARRLTFAGHGSLDSYLQQLAAVDIALDPFPYSGETTALHALWMGLPVIALEGDTLAGRLASRVLRVGGLHEWVARSSDEYVALAVHVARDFDGLARIRRELRGRLSASPLLDQRGVTRELEAAYRQMWRRFCADT